MQLFKHKYLTNLIHPTGFNSDWLSKQEIIDLDGSVFINRDLTIVVGGSLETYSAKKMKENLHPDFVALIDWKNPPLVLSEAHIDIVQLVSDVEMMNK